MNARLTNIYNDLVSKHQQKFLANDISLDDMWGKPIKGITLQIDLSEKVKSEVCNIQEEMSKLEPDSLLLSPRSFQHISFNQVVYWGGNYKFGHDRTWETIEHDFLSKFQKLDHVFSSFTISFIKLIPMSSAIIWYAVDEQDDLQTLREQLKTILPFPSETIKYNTFIHTTIARYKKKLRAPNRVSQFLENFSTPIFMKVSEIILRKENRYPSLHTTELARIRLQ